MTRGAIEFADFKVELDGYELTLRMELPLSDVLANDEYRLDAPEVHLPSVLSRQASPPMHVTVQMPSTPQR